MVSQRESQYSTPTLNRTVYTSTYEWHNEELFRIKRRRSPPMNVSSVLNKEILPRVPGLEGSVFTIQYKSYCRRVGWRWGEAWWRRRLQRPCVLTCAAKVYGRISWV